MIDEKKLSIVKFKHEIAKVHSLWLYVEFSNRQIRLGIIDDPFFRVIEKLAARNNICYEANGLDMVIINIFGIKEI